jgi:hypothetical protein
VLLPHAYSLVTGSKTMQGNSDWNCWYFVEVYQQYRVEGFGPGQRNAYGSLPHLGGALTL